MTEPRSLAYQRTSILHLIAINKDQDGTIIEAAKQAALTIGWLERHGELLKMWASLRKDNPELFEVMRSIASEFPGAKIASIREAAE